MAKSLVFGGNVSESLASYDHESSCWKTYQLSLFGGEEKWLGRLPQSGMIQNGKLYQLGCSVRLISANDGSLSDILPTPTASQNHKKIRPLSPSEKKGTHGIALVGAIGNMILPTPTTDQRPQRYKQGGRSTWCAILEDGVMLPTPTAKANQTAPTMRKHWKGMLPTPTAHLAKESASPSDYKRKSPPLLCHFQQETSGEKMYLNPQFVEWMMGFPTGWTDLEL